MISINKQGNAIVIEFTDNDKYLFNGTIEIAPNELMIVIDESNMATFKRSTNGDTLFSQLINKIQIGGTNVTKDTILDEFAKIGFTTGSGGSGGSVNSVNGQTGDVVITATSLGAITKADADTLYAAKSDLNSKADISAVPSNTQFNNLAGEVANKADKTSVYTKAEADEKFATNAELNHVKSDLANKADTSSLNNYALKSEITGLATKKELANYQPIGDYATTTQLNSKQDTLVSGTNIKTVNGKSILGNGDIEISSVIDAEMSDTSEHAVQNKVIKQYVDTASSKLTSSLSTKANSADVYTKSESDAKYLTEHQSLENYALKTEIPDITGLATKEELALKANSSDIPTKTSQLVNDSGYLTEHQSLANYATKSEIPTATSQLTNDSGFITKIPDTYVTNEELTSALSSKADSANVYTKAEIDNMIGQISARLDQINGEVI